MDGDGFDSLANDLRDIATETLDDEAAFEHVTRLLARAGRLCHERGLGHFDEPRDFARQCGRPGPTDPRELECIWGRQFSLYVSQLALKHPERFPHWTLVLGASVVSHTTCGDATGQTLTTEVAYRPSMWRRMAREGADVCDLLAASTSYRLSEMAMDPTGYGDAGDAGRDRSWSITLPELLFYLEDKGCEISESALRRT